jgi:isopentenyl-diphosphate delta-isomerase
MSHSEDPNGPAGLGQRKDQHIDLVLERPVEHAAPTLLGDVNLLHDSLPELDLADIRLDRRWFGRTLAAPLLVSGMTGGSDRAGAINRELAVAAEAAGVALGTGSMRPLLADPTRRPDYDLRPLAPSIPLLGNLGVMQAAEQDPRAVGEQLQGLGYDALCIHLNPAQELAQAEGDRRFRGALATIARWVQDCPLSVVVKETGAGMSPHALDRLRAAGADWVDVSGRGGTSWTKVEAERPGADTFGRWFGDWGLPTAASVVWARRRGLRAVASGGIRDPHDALRALALGADMVGIARPVLLAVAEGGAAGAERWLKDFVEGLRRGLLLVGAADIAGLRRLPRRIGPELASWLAIDSDDRLG